MIVDSEDGMRSLVLDYFNNVFAAPGEGISRVAVKSPRCINHNQNELLTAEVTFEKFTVAMGQMHHDKSAGPDGLNPPFYQNFWKVLGREVFQCCKKWLQGDSFPADLNSTNIVLILKKDNAACLKDLRIIALCNVLYKIMAKVLENRLKKVLPGLISENQSTFVPGRCITDNVVVAFEIIHHMRGKKRNQT